VTDYETVVSWIAERAPTEVYAALVRLRLGGRCQGCEDAPVGQHTGPHDWEAVPPVQKRMGEVIRGDSVLIAELRLEIERLRQKNAQLVRELTAYDPAWQAES
jgi:hypothetical protein